MTPSVPTRRSSELLPGEVDSDIDDQEPGALGHGLDEGDKRTALNEQIEAVVAKGAIIIGGDGPRRPRRDADPLRIGGKRQRPNLGRSEEHTSELQSLMRISYAVFCLQKNIKKHIQNKIH